VKSIFLDTVGLIALWDEADQWHSAAQGAFAKLQQSGFSGVTTEPVLLECGNAAARRPYRAEVYELRRQLMASGRLISPTESDFENAWNNYRRGRPGDPGIVDCISFAVMRRLGLTEVFTKDQHFAAAGFTTLF
jgi:predicted nucleic acid-binding protein